MVVLTLYSTAKSNTKDLRITMVQTRRKNYNIINHGTGNIDEEIIDNSDETMLEEVSISIISALFHNILYI